MKRKLIVFLSLCLCLILLTFPSCAFADTESDLNDKIDEGLGNIDFGGVEEIADDAIGGVVAKIKEILDGNFDGAESFLAFLGDVLFSDVKTLLPTLATVLVICILCGLIQKNKGSFISEGTDNVIYFVGFAVILVSVITSLFGIYKSVSGLLGRISALTDACMPIMLTLMIANGGNVTASVYQPGVAMLSGTVINIVSNVILPLTAFGLVFTVISNLSDNVRVTKMSAFFNSCSSWLLGIIFMVFSAFMSVQGITAASIDGVSVRAAKFATKNYIPFLGGYLSDGFDLIVASTSLIKNAFGLVSLLLLLAALLSPLINIIAYNLGLQLVAAVAEPLADKKYISFLSAVSKNLTFLAVLVIAVAFMFFIMVMLAVYTANGV